MNGKWHNFSTHSLCTVTTISIASIITTTFTTATIIITTFPTPLPRFVSLLSQLEIEQAEQGGAMERFLDMHMYITSALQKTDMKAVGLQLALELLHQKVKS